MTNNKNHGIPIIVNILLLAAIVYASTSLTLSFFGSIGTAEVRTSNLMLGLVNDACKVFLPICIGIMMQKKKFAQATLLVVITAGTMFISYMASQGLDLNVANSQLLDGSKKNEIVAIKDDLTAQKKSLEIEKNTRVAELTASMQNLPANYITKRREAQEQINKLVTEYNNSIASKDAEISNYNTKIVEYKVDDTMSTEGYHALAKSLGSNVDTVVKWKNIFLEVLAVVLSLNLGNLLGESSKFNWDFLKRKEKEEVELEDKEEKNKVQENEKPEKKKSYLNKLKNLKNLKMIK